jgi:hypothetical protein
MPVLYNTVTDFRIVLIQGASPTTSDYLTVLSSNYPTTTPPTCSDPSLSGVATINYNYTQSRMDATETPLGLGSGEHPPPLSPQHPFN